MTTDGDNSSATKEAHAYRFWPASPEVPTIEAGKYCPMSQELYGRFEIVWRRDHPELSVGVHDWWHFFGMTDLHRALQVEKATPKDIIAALARLGFENISECEEGRP